MADLPQGAASSGDDAVRAAVAAWYATEQLETECLTYLHRSVVPSLVLWAGAWRPLPGLVTWLAVLAWGICAAVAVVLGVAAIRRRQGLAETLPEASRVVRFHFAPASASGLPAASAFLFTLSVAASLLLWIHGWAPRLLPPDVVATAATCWLLLLVAAAGNKYLEVR